MSFCVDTCVLIDIADADPEFGEASAHCLAQRVGAGLVISPVSYIELAPVFDGSSRLLDEFLVGLGVVCDGDMSEPTRRSAFSAWGRHIAARRAGGSSRRPVADVMIGALALQHEAIITRNAKDFRTLFPKLHIVTP
jgi:predicted nucleic acid-binding protein